jgi:hypothetical protein
MEPVFALRARAAAELTRPLVQDDAPTGPRRKRRRAQAAEAAAYHQDVGLHTPSTIEGGERLQLVSCSGRNR